MRTLSRSVLFSASLLALPASMFAQRQGAIEIGGFGRFSKFADTLQLKPGIGGGGRAGLYIFRNVLAEMEVKSLLA